jgi:hypothetical protein
MIRIDSILLATEPMDRRVDTASGGTSVRGANPEQPPSNSATTLIVISNLQGEDINIHRMSLPFIE